MNKMILAVLTIAVVAPAPMPTFAYADPETIEQECRQAAQEDGVLPEEIEDYVADCIAEGYMPEGGASAEEGEPAEGGPPGSE